MKNYDITLTGGDVLAMEWTGNVWRDPRTGATYSDKSTATDSIVARYLEACGLPCGDDDIADAIQSVYLADDSMD
jgi:hypothetical protein